MDGHDEQRQPGIGDLAKDTTKDKVGVLTDMAAGRFVMRPLTHGQEWEVDPADVVAVTALEEMRARNSARNRMTRLGL
ncbi:hypothetical protein [Streptomyces sp. P17]|uniref:hypothetical protein n=1 Tax=Streptomyces sp. P17 TaxID=3074716 RepID=UPI0028F46032|nr:hypothetical protein [Streptomyces sp. P17]MDT9698272.1 hypothetical protein [Streptomyces sp. P17]